MNCLTPNSDDHAEQGRHLRVHDVVTSPVAAKSLPAPNMQIDKFAARPAVSVFSQGGKRKNR